MRPTTITHKVSRSELESLYIPVGSNLVLVHVPHQNKDTTTKSGLLVIGDMDFKPAEHAERWGYIYSLPKELVYNNISQDPMGWETTLECSVGDKVWFDYRAAMYAHTLECDGEWYKLLNYGSLYVVQDSQDRIIPLNGYLLLKKYVNESSGSIVVSAKVDDRFATVFKSGSKNARYRLDIWNDNIDVYDGDSVLFEAETVCFPLESELHRTFPEPDVFLQHRKRVLAVVTEDHSEVVRIHDGVVGVVERPAKL
jgi:hypothetical protein